MSLYTNFLKLFKYNPLTDQDDPFNIEKALNDNWDKIDNKVNEVAEQSNDIATELVAHENKVVSQIISVTRDLSLTGTQIITGFSDTPKKITILSTFAGSSSKRFSLGIGNQTEQMCVGIYENGLTGPTVGNSILIGDNATNRVLGSVKIVGNTLEITWSIDGAGVVGTGVLRINADYHGEGA